MLPAAAREETLPECKIKRNYLCMLCSYFTQNPRFYLHHMRDVHNEKMRIYECHRCLYASKHSQKLHRHVAMVHAANKPPRRRPSWANSHAAPPPSRTGLQQLPPLKLKTKPPGPGPGRGPISAPNITVPKQQTYVVKNEPEERAPDGDDAEFPDDDSNDRLVIEYPEEEDEKRASGEGGQGEDEEEEEAAEGAVGMREGEAAEEEECGEAAAADEDDVQEHAEQQAVDTRLEMDPVTRQFKCSSCCFQSKTPSLVARHESVVHLKRKFYRCNKCTYVTHLKARFTKHYKYHTMPLIKCSECDFRTPYKWNLDRHLKNHNGLGNFKCSVCSFAADIKQSLTVHEMNHHSPPVGGPMDRSSGSRRRCRVGGSDCRNMTEEDNIEEQERELLRLEREDSSNTMDLEALLNGDGSDAVKSKSREFGSSGSPGSDREIKGGRSKPLRCSQCDYRSSFIADMSRHMFNKHGAEKSPRQTQASDNGAPPAKRVAKPLPNLIPILSPAQPASPIKVRSGQSLLKSNALSKLSNLSDLPDASTVSSDFSAPASPDDVAGELEEQGGSPDPKNSFFDQLKLFPGSSTDPSLICIWCGHEAKCISELVRHNKLHSGQSRGVTASSTRCQHCRHRCKTHSELVKHLETCVKAAEASKSNEKQNDHANSLDSPGKTSDPAIVPMENGEAVWNSIPDEERVSDSELIRDGELVDGEEGEEVHDDDEPDVDDADSVGSVPTADPGLVGVETAPGYGAVHSQNEFEASLDTDPKTKTATSLKKVFKCPHCSFWASTASRFHVHIVGHLNKKPFECSLCNYRSNWRWDITKHIRLKVPRDPSHEGAKVLMIDETGRRNYSKYNKYLMLLRVAEPNADNPSPNSGRQSKAVASGMQGNVPGPVDLVPILPAPPKLTRAPAPRPSASAPPVVSGALLRPPPPLQAGTTHLIILPAGMRLQQSQLQLQSGQVVSTPSQSQMLVQPGSDSAQPLPPVGQSPKSIASKRPADGSPSKQGSEPKKSNSEIKKTVWRCKQCHFRDGDRAIVLAHVKGHYRQQQEAALAKLNTNTSPSSAMKGSPFDTSLKGTVLHCTICPFTAISDSLMEIHMKHHKQTSDAIFKCYLCPYYVNSKDELLQHTTVHNVLKSEENESLQKDAENQNNAVSAVQQSAVLSQKNISEEMKSTVKKNDSQNVASTNGNDKSLPVSAPNLLDVQDLADAPYCWVFRNERLVKMYRCRYCPHVNSRKSNIVEHERMHGKRLPPPSSEYSEITTSQYAPYPCPVCNYVCNNAGVLSSHMKVHLVNYPQAYSLVDTSRSDQEQMNEIIDKFSLQLSKSPDAKSKTAVSPPELGHENKLKNIDLMSLLNPNQSLTDAILAMKKKFNLELDGEPFAEPHEDFLESPPTSPLKQLNEDLDPMFENLMDEKRLHFCRQCPARFLFRKELGIHSRFHNLHLIHRCENCSYTARQRTHLQAHSRVHSDDYQERTTALLRMYQVHKDFPMPRTAAIAQKPGAPGALWVVVNAVTKPSPSNKGSSAVEKAKFFCTKCPASFFKTLALQYHSTLHGGDGAHKCRVCDYAVKTYGNLVKHMTLHGVQMSPKKSKKELKKVPGFDSSISDSLRREDESDNSKDKETAQGGLVKTSLTEKDDVKENDPVDASHKNAVEELGLMFSGSPNFVYPTYFRNGRMKEKRYKCHKCPSAFEKREQYKIHQALHGSNQRYKCGKCDYSVKYYANYIQHLRRHKSSEEAKAAASTDDTVINSSEIDDFTSEDSENTPVVPPSSPIRSGKTTGGKGEKLSVADKQALMIMQQRRAKRSLTSQEPLHNNYWCSYCPYSSPRRDQVESHMKRHIAESGLRNAFVCEHCDYSVPNKHFLRDHYKLHFDVSKAPRPEAFMICDQLELWASDCSIKNQSKGKVLVFQDKSNADKNDRFLPPLVGTEDSSNEPLENQVFISLKTFEPETKTVNGEKEANECQESIENRMELDVDEDLKDNISQQTDPSVVNTPNSSAETSDVSSVTNNFSSKHESDSLDSSCSSREPTMADEKITV